MYLGIYSRFIVTSACSGTANPQQFPIKAPSNSQNNLLGLPEEALYLQTYLFMSEHRTNTGRSAVSYCLLIG